MNRILVCGDRNWRDRNCLFRELDNVLGLYPNMEIIEGECAGVDLMAKEWAVFRGVPYRGFPANWKVHGKSAGPIRNRLMLDEKPDMVMAFHGNIESSKGTKDCIFEANKRRIKVILIGL